MPPDFDTSRPLATRPSVLELIKQLESLRSEMRRRHREYASVFERVRLGHRHGPQTHAGAEEDAAFARDERLHDRPSNRGQA